MTQMTKLLAMSMLFLPLVANAALPHAVCRPTGDRPETGLSGETTADERDAGVATLGFKCNTDLVGQYQGEGASWQLSAWKSCAYFDQRNPADGVLAGSPVESQPGSIAVDVSDPTNPKPTAWMSDIALIDPWESLKVNPARQLVGGGQRPLGGSETQPGDGFSLYSIATDCTKPAFQATAHLPGSFGHTGQFAPDGNTYWITPLQNSPSILAVDTTDATNPQEIAGSLVTFTADQLALPRLHDLEFSKDGNTAYITMFGSGATASGNGFAILDVSDFQQRKPNPQYRVISQLTWNDGSIGAQNALPITIAGKPYVLVTDEAGAGAGGCSKGFSANGFPRIIDVSDPTTPVVVAKLQMDVADPANCTYISTAPITSIKTTLSDGGVEFTTGPGGFAHSCHYCNVDNVDDAKIAGCNCFAAGLRFFDIHDVSNPKEMAYYKPPAQGTKFLPSSQYTNRNADPTFFRSYDWGTSKVSFPNDRGDTSGDVWTTSQDNGFMVISLFSQVTVTPATATSTIGDGVPLTATVTGAAATAGVNWSVEEAEGATISANGTFFGTTAGTYHAIATSILDATKSGTSTITVSDSTPAPASGSSGGCTSAPAGISFLAVPLGLLVWSLRRRKPRA